MADDNTDVEVEVRVRPLLGHWEPVGSRREKKQYQEHLTSNGGLTTSVWKQSKQDEGLAVSVSQSFRYTGEEVGSRLATTKKADSKLHCLWEASPSITQEPPLITQAAPATEMSNSSTTFYANGKDASSRSLSAGSLCGAMDSVPNKADTAFCKGSIVAPNEPSLLTPPLARRRFTKKRPTRTSSMESNQGINKSPVVKEKKREEAKKEEARRAANDKKQSSEEVTVSLSLPVKPEQPAVAPTAAAAAAATTVSEWKCWVMLVLFLAIVCIYRTQLVAECPDE